MNLNWVVGRVGSRSDSLVSRRLTRTRAARATKICRTCAENLSLVRPKSVARAPKICRTCDKKPSHVRQKTVARCSLYPYVFKYSKISNTTVPAACEVRRCDPCALVRLRVPYPGPPVSFYRHPVPFTAFWGSSFLECCSSRLASAPGVQREALHSPSSTWAALPLMTWSRARWPLFQRTPWMGCHVCALRESFYPRIPTCSRS